MKFQEVFEIINHTSSLSVLIPLVIGLIRRKTFNTELKVLFLYILLSCFAEILGFIFIQNNIRTSVVSTLFTLGECSLLSYIYFNRFDTKSSKILIMIFYLFFLAITLYLGIKSRFSSQNGILNTFEAAFFITLSGGYIVKVMREMNISRLKETYFTYINTGVLLYFSMAILLFLFYSYIEKSGLKTYNNLYSLHWIINIGYNVLLALGIWKFRIK